jgi:hypothetical protein
MSDPAARPWWADVQHLRPREARGEEPSVRERGQGVATLEHEVADPPPDRTTDAPARWTPEAPAWDELEEAFARSPSWTDDEAWLMPKGADRIENGRRTIEIRGQVDRVAGISAPAETGAATRTGRRRPSPRVAERLAGRPDRVAMWAFLLGLMLILIAALSGPGDASAVAGAVLPA